MSFFGLFGKSEDNSNKLLREHLKKCAGLGQRPPLFNCCDLSDPCADRTGCSNRPEDEEPCPEPERVMLVPYCPKCEVPPTLTFNCPEDKCEAPPPPPNKCCPKAKDGKEGVCKKPKETDEQKAKRCKKPEQSWCGSPNSCETKPLRM